MSDAEQAETRVATCVAGLPDLAVVLRREDGTCATAADLRALLAERDALLADLEKVQATADVRQGQIQALRESVNKWRDKYQVALCCGGMEGCPECAARTHTQEGE